MARRHASSIRVGTDELVEFRADRHHAILATLRRADRLPICGDGLHDPIATGGFTREQVAA